MKVTQENSLVFNAAKYDSCQPQIACHGCLFMGDGIISDKMKFQSIADMPYPADIQQLLSFFCMVNYIWPFVPHISHHKELLMKNRQHICMGCSRQSCLSAAIGPHGLSIPEAALIVWSFHNHHCTGMCPAEASALAFSKRATYCLFQDLYGHRPTTQT